MKFNKRYIAYDKKHTCKLQCSQICVRSQRGCERLESSAITICNSERITHLNQTTTKVSSACDSMLTARAKESFNRPQGVERLARDRRKKPSNIQLMSRSVSALHALTAAASCAQTAGKSNTASLGSEILTCTRSHESVEKMMSSWCFLHSMSENEYILMSACAARSNERSLSHAHTRMQTKQ